MGVSATFNVGDLSPYLDDSSLRTNSSKEGENDPRSNTLPHESVALVLEVLGFNPFKSEFVTCLTWVED